MAPFTSMGAGSSRTTPGRARAHRRSSPHARPRRGCRRGSRARRCWPDVVRRSLGACSDHVEHVAEIADRLGGAAGGGGCVITTLLNAPEARTRLGMFTRALTSVGRLRGFLSRPVNVRARGERTTRDRGGRRIVCPPSRACAIRESPVGAVTRRSEPHLPPTRDEGEVASRRDPVGRRPRTDGSDGAGSCR